MLCCLHATHLSFTHWHSQTETLEGQSQQLGADTERTQEVVSEGGAMLQKGESVEDGEEEEEPSK